MSKMELGSKLQLRDGLAYHCTKNLFINCCDTKSKIHWIEELGFKKCKEEEFELKDLRVDKKCIYVGEVIKSKILPLGNTEKQKTFCCYETEIIASLNRMAKQESEKGTAKEPNCSSLSLETIEERLGDIKQYFSDQSEINLQREEL